jgi:hypothetical protein
MFTEKLAWLVPELGRTRSSSPCGRYCLLGSSVVCSGWVVHELLHGIWRNNLWTTSRRTSDCYLLRLRCSNK